MVELEGQENNIWNEKLRRTHDNIFYSKHIRDKASSDSSKEYYATSKNQHKQDIWQQPSPNDLVDVSVIDNPIASDYFDAEDVHITAPHVTVCQDGVSLEAKVDEISSKWVSSYVQIIF